MASTIAVQFLNLGKLLWERSSKGRPRIEPAKVEAAETELIAAVHASRSATLREVLSFNRQGKNIDPALLRALCFVSFTTLCAGRRPPTVADVACAVSGDSPESILDARQALAKLCLRNHIAFEQYGGLELGKQMLTFMAGGPGAAPLVVTESDVRAARQKAEMDDAKRKAKDISTLPSAKELAERIAKDVIGSEAEVRTIACRLAMHIRRSAMIKAGNDPGSPNECLLFIGPSGSGKTHLAQTAGKASDLPFGSVSSTDLTAEGYIGMSVDDAVKQVLVAADYDVERARYGICLFDEWDKKRTAGWDFGSRDIGGASVQQAVLRLMEGAQHQIGGRKGSYDWTPTMINTRGTCFIFCGTFIGLEKLFSKISGTGIGFGKQLDETKHEAALYDSLEAYGLIPEFLNRLSGIVVFAEPSLQQLISIAERSIVPAYNRMLAPGGAEIRVAEDAVRIIAGCARESRTYARGIKSVLSRLVEGIVFEQTTGTVTITKTEVREAIGAIGLVEVN